MTGTKVRVLVVDDSPVTRRFLSKALEADPELTVVGTAPDGILALDFLRQNRSGVDVVTLDVHMPNLDGLATLGEIVRMYRLPCVMVSSATRAEARVTLEALAAGAVDFFAKPAGEDPVALAEHGDVLRQKVKAAAGADLARLLADRPELLAASFPMSPRRDLVILGASTGGPKALRTILACFPGDFPARFVVAQHMPRGGFTAELARQLGSVCRLPVEEAADGSVLAPGTVLVAPGGYLSELERKAGKLVVRVREERRSTLPSVDALFESAARLEGERTIGVILTGMGSDGTEGMKKLAAARAATLAESRRSSVVFGMPGSAVRAGVVEREVSKEQMAEEILHRMLF